MGVLIEIVEVVHPLISAIQHRKSNKILSASDTSVWAEPKTLSGTLQSRSSRECRGAILQKNPSGHCYGVNKLIPRISVSLSFNTNEFKIFGKQKAFNL